MKYVTIRLAVSDDTARKIMREAERERPVWKLDVDEGIRRGFAGLYVAKEPEGYDLRGMRYHYMPVHHAHVEVESMRIERAPRERRR